MVSTAGRADVTTEAAGACRVFLARLPMLRDHHVALLDERELARAARYRFPEDRDRFTLGAVLVRAAAGQHVGAPAASMVVDRSCDRCGEPHGRPRVVDADVHASVSHSGDVVAVAVTSVGPVGVDVEATDRRGVDYREILQAVCTPDEQAFVAGPEDFVTVWVRKEAVLKATGHGLRMPMTEVVVTPPAQRSGCISVGEDGLQCQLVDFDAGDGYRGAVALLAATPVPSAVLSADALLRRL